MCKEFAMLLCFSVEQKRKMCNRFPYWSVVDKDDGVTKTVN